MFASGWVRRRAESLLLLVALAPACTGNKPTPPAWMPPAAPSATTTTIPLQLNNLTVDAPAVTGGAATQGVVGLNAPAPSGGALVTLSSSDAAVTVPPAVSVPAGEVTARFPVTTRSVSRDITATITARFPVDRPIEARLPVWAVLPTSFTWFSTPPNFYDGGAGRFTPDDTRIIAMCQESFVRIDVIRNDNSNTWSLIFSAPVGTPLLPGVYDNASPGGAGFQNRNNPALLVSGRNFGCQAESGRFVVSEAAFTPAGAVQRFVATFETKCPNNSGGVVLSGEIRLADASMGVLRPDKACLR